MEHSSTQQAFIDAPVQTVWDLLGDPNRHPSWWPDVIDVNCADLREGCRYRGIVKGFVKADEHDLLLECLDDCHEISIFCEDTGVTTRFLLTEAQGGTFVEGYFAIEPNTLGMKVVGAVSGRRVMRSWLERSLENLKHEAEQAAAAPA